MNLHFVILAKAGIHGLCFFDGKPETNKVTGFPPSRE